MRRQQLEDWEEKNAALREEIDKLNAELTELSQSQENGQSLDEEDCEKQKATLRQQIGDLEFQIKSLSYLWEESQKMKEALLAEIALLMTSIHQATDDVQAENIRNPNDVDGDDENYDDLEKAQEKIKQLKAQAERDWKVRLAIGKANRSFTKTRKEMVQVLRELLEAITGRPAPAQDPENGVKVMFDLRGIVALLTNECEFLIGDRDRHRAEINNFEERIEILQAERGRAQTSAREYEEQLTAAQLEQSRP